MAAASHWSTGAADALDLIEVQSAVLVRNFELLRRRGDVYGGLDRAGYLLLRVLEAIGPADINTLAAAVGLDPSTAGRQVAAMQQAGLIERTPAPADRRRSIVTPTPEGRTRANDVRGLRRESLVELLSGWTEDELRAVGDGFARYNQAVAEHYLGVRADVPPAEQPATDQSASDQSATDQSAAGETPTDEPRRRTGHRATNPTSNDRKESPRDEQ
ncbi:MAG TPA: MarR family winged helix-turn-helix transcriptional regulator [Rugosimonospora sp.]